MQACGPAGYDDTSMKGLTESGGSQGVRAYLTLRGRLVRAQRRHTVAAGTRSALVSVLPDTAWLALEHSRASREFSGGASGTR